jgi:acyl-coenzyme A synthetase/AMP-(fatty) acid ligase
VVADRAEYAPPGVPSILVPELAAAADASALSSAGAWPGLDDPFMLSLTSGTTGVPKAIAHTHGSFPRRVRRNLYDTGVAPRLLPPGLHIIVGIGGAFHALFEGGALVFPRGYDALPFLEAVRRHEVTHIMLPPANMANLARASTGPMASLRQVRFLGGTPSAPLVALARERLSPNLLSVYGTVETASIASADGALLARSPTSVGHPCADAVVEVIDEEGRALPAGTSGHLRMRVAEMAQGYFGPDAEDRSRFRDGWYYPRDVGRIDGDGLLYVEGRSDDVINLGGRKFLPAAIEAMLEEHPGVREAAVFLPEGAERLEAAIVGDPALDLAALARSCAQRLELLAPARFHRVASLPRNALGKLEREKLVGSDPH